MSEDKKPWFETKRYGLGAGLPIAWQGWALIFAYLAVALLSTYLIIWDKEVGIPIGIALLTLSTIALIVVSKARTRGGWRWRWGDKD